MSPMPGCSLEKHFTTVLVWGYNSRMQTRSVNILGTGAVLNLAAAFGATSMSSKWVQVTTGKTNTSNVRMGGGEVTSIIGYQVAPNFAGMFLPPISEVANLYALERVNVYVAAGDTLDVLIGVD